MLTPLDATPWIIGMVMTVILDPVWQGINRIMRHDGEPKEQIIGVLWVFTLGLFGIGWLLDIVSMGVYKTIKVFA